MGESRTLRQRPEGNTVDDFRVSGRNEERATIIRCMLSSNKRRLRKRLSMLLLSINAEGSNLRNPLAMYEF